MESILIVAALPAIIVFLLGVVFVFLLIFSAPWMLLLSLVVRKDWAKAIRKFYGGFFK